MNPIRFTAISVLLVGVILLLTTKSKVYGQDVTCEPVLKVIASAIENCSELNKNWACYGHADNRIFPKDIRFIQPKDRQPIAVIEEIFAEYRDGTALLRLQLQTEANPVTAILFGAIHLRPDKESDEENVFLLQGSNSEYLCEKTPSGMVVRTEEGQRGRITLNGVTVELESTAYIALRNADLLEVVNIEGNVTVSVDALGVSQQLGIGESSQITLQNNIPITISLPSPADISASSVIQWLATDDDGLRRVTDSNSVPNPAVQACGGAITYDQSIVDEHHVSGQECLFTFTGAVGDVVTIHLDALEDNLDPWVELRDPTMKLVKANNDIDTQENNSLICNRGLLTAGTYTIVARPYNNASIGKFRLTLSRTSACNQPPILCEVLTGRVMLRAAPRIDAPPPVRSLIAHSRLYLLDHAEQTPWRQVRVAGSDDEGWILWPASKLGCDTDRVAEVVSTCQPYRPAGWVDHIVAANETLSGLAVTTGTSAARLSQVNCLVDTLIRVGQRLYVPSPPCRDVMITDLSVNPGPASATVRWRATGGCLPLAGTLSVRYSSGSGANFAVAGAGALNLAYPANATCFLSARYSLKINDRSGQGASVIRDVPLPIDCPKLAPFPTP